jgi:hypothetical protein
MSIGDWLKNTPAQSVEEEVYLAALRLTPAERVALTAWYFTREQEDEDAEVAAARPSRDARLEARWRAAVAGADEGFAWEQVRAELPMTGSARRLALPVFFTADARAELHALVAMFADDHRVLRDWFTIELEAVLSVGGEMVLQYERRNPDGPPPLDDFALHSFPLTIFFIRLSTHFLVFAVGDRRDPPWYWSSYRRLESPRLRVLAMAGVVMSPSLWCGVIRAALASLYWDPARTGAAWSSAIDRRVEDAIEHPQQAVDWSALRTDLSVEVPPPEIAPARRAYLTKPVRFSLEAAREVMEAMRHAAALHPRLHLRLLAELDHVVPDLSFYVPCFDADPADRPRTLRPSGLPRFPHDLICIDLPHHVRVVGFGDVSPPRPRLFASSAP